MRVWECTNINGDKATVCCMTKEYAGAIMSGADAIEVKDNCAVTDKNLEFAYLVELLHQKKEGISVSYLTSLAEEYAIKLTDTSLHMYCQPVIVGRYVIDGEDCKFYYSQAIAERYLEGKNYMADGYKTATISVPVFVLECLQDGRIGEYDNTYVITDSSGYRQVALAPIGAQEEAKIADKVGTRAIVEIMLATGLPLVMTDSGSRVFVASGTIIGPSAHIMTMARASGAYLLEP